MIEVVPLGDDAPAADDLATVDLDTPLGEQMMAAAEDAGRSAPEPIADFALDVFEADGLLDRVPRPMSRGERQLCALLITLSAPIATLTLVDPTAGLDGRRRRAVVDLLIDLAEDRPIHVTSDDSMFDVVRPWEPLGLAEVAAVLESATFRWWITGAHALELHVGDRWREHDDIDVSVCRDDARAVRRHLGSWDLQIAAGGVLRPWDGAAPLAPDRNENNLWCRRTSTAPFCLDIGISEGDDDEWVYRRNPTTRRAWADAVLRSRDGVPYLAPELQLLFKSVRPRRKDTIDAGVVIPRLRSDRRDWLARSLPANHEWQGLFDASNDPALD